MDKNKINNSLPSDLDDLHVKDHLNTSFDMDNITVSEDLIARTLKAIEESETQEEQLKESNKIKHFPVRRLVSAAAAVVVLIVGFNILQSGFTGNKKDIQLDIYSGTAGETLEDTEVPETYGVTAADEGASLSNGTKSSEVTDSSAAENKVAADEDAALYSAELKEDTNKAGGGTGSVLGGELFSGLFPINYDTVQTFTLSKNDGTNKTSADISIKTNEFYNILDGYPLTVKDARKNGNADDWTYKAEIILPNEQTYTIMIGDTIQVEQKSKTNKTQVLVYSTENMENLIKQIQDFYNSMDK